MPKRIPTPPPGDDEPRYLTVVHPYVLDGHCNMELPKDRQDFARWVACCIDAKYFYAFFHKPSARDMVIIEIARECPELDRLLGEHRWREFLKKSSKQEQDQVSKVFYCTYSTGRQVQKNGWKRIYVEDAWFKMWSPNNHLITFPYPETHFCEVPIEDQTNHPMCRPLPGAVKRPPPEALMAPPPVVGSEQWTTDKQVPAPIARWTKGAPKFTAPVGNAWKAAIAASSPPIPGLKKQPAVGGGPIAVKASDVWVGLPASSGLGPNGWSDSPTGSGRNTPPSGAPSPLPRTISNQSPTIPPGLSGPKAWDDGTSYPTHPPGIPAVHNAWGAPRIATAPSLDRDNTSIASWSSNGGSSNASTDIVLTPEDCPYRVQVQISDSMERALDGLSVHDGDMDPDLAELDSIAPGRWDEPASTDVWPTADGATWDDAPADAEAQWMELNDNKEQEKPIICNAHGIICRKGICREYAKQVRDAERAQKDTGSNNKKGKGRGRGREYGRGGGEGGGRVGGGGGTDRGGPPNNAFRGRGAPVKSNWRSAPRAIVSAAAMERRESLNEAESVAAETANGWGNPSNASWNAGEDVPEEAEPAGNGAPEPSNDGWGQSEASFDPWLIPSEPKPKPQQKPAPQSHPRLSPSLSGGRSRSSNRSRSSHRSRKPRRTPTPTTPGSSRGLPLHGQMRWMPIALLDTLTMMGSPLPVAGVVGGPR
ncbi:uncharacterized protein HD556DRAFT_863198 [Suillus plorans]|uniref:Uncharacterized protein n=1 Tax=Suillus plorans TaxID=116603 RepID=A0A9P7AFK9_9AGAM|nr:uncharacterized protein HD556DRAFT_863198 [Suillus plorans]KAG1788324.1 hypothetical protein HD556DRAFT_863198 [Suillus plorans]